MNPTGYRTNSAGYRTDESVNRVCGMVTRVLAPLQRCSFPEMLRMPHLFLTSKPISPSIARSFRTSEGGSASVSPLYQAFTPVPALALLGLRDYGSASFVKQPPRRSTPILQLSGSQAAHGTSYCRCVVRSEYVEGDLDGMEERGNAGCQECVAARQA